MISTCEGQLWTEIPQLQHIGQPRTGTVKYTKEHQREKQSAQYDTNRNTASYHATREMMAVAPGTEEKGWGGVSGDLSLPGPWCPAHSEVSGWHCQSSAAGAAEHRLWADRPPLCRRSLTETRQKGKTGMKGRKERKHKEHTNKGTYVCMCVCVCDPSVIHWIEADLRRSSGESHPSDSRPIHGAVSSLCSWVTPARWHARSRENMVYIHSCVMFMYGGSSK